MFYDKFAELCRKRGVSPSRAAVDAGISKSLVTKWKNNQVRIPSADVIGKLCQYFGVTVSEMLDEEADSAVAAGASREDVDFKAAFFEGYGDDLSEEEKDDLWEDARQYAKFKAMQKKARKD